MTNEYQECIKFNGFHIGEEQTRILEYFNAFVRGEPIFNEAGVQHLAYLAGEIGDIDFAKLREEREKAKEKGKEDKSAYQSIAEKLILDGTLNGELNRQFILKRVEEEKTCHLNDLLRDQELVLREAVRRYQKGEPVNQLGILEELTFRYQMRGDQIESPNWERLEEISIGCPGAR